MPALPMLRPRSPPGREQVEAAFNDPDSPVRVLVATDAASEGLDFDSQYSHSA